MQERGVQRADGLGRERAGVWLRALSRSLAAAPTSVSAYAFFVVLVATVVAKSAAARSMAGGGPFLFDALGACAADMFVYPLLALLLVAGEGIRRWLAYLTYPLSVLAVVVALINAAYVAIANDQIDARVLLVGMNRFDEVADIALLEALSRAGHIGVYALLALPLGYALITWAWRRTGVPAHELSVLRLRGLLISCALGGLTFVTARVAELPRTLAADLISDNALIHTYVTWLDNVFAPLPTDEGTIVKHFAPPMVAPNAVERLRHGQRPNVLILVLESTRFDHVELPLSGHVSAARTPNLLSLAKRGTFFTNVQAAMPHTSKSLVSLLCGRLPAMENPVLEAADGVLRDCLPEVLRGAGYATTFLQSALGGFEYRPRLTTRLGYEDFAAFENIGAAPTGYLSGDDRALPRAFDSWLSSLPPERPFFATLLTSGTHHPYQLPSDVDLSHAADARARYAALVQIEDQVLGSLLEVLSRTGRLASTVVLAVADHGEGLQGDAVHQHDNNFFEESLHVPMIMAGPGIASAQQGVLTSLLDVAPMVLRALQVETTLPADELRFGVNATRRTSRALAPFACWNDGMCEGFVSRAAKVVRLIADHRVVAFDRVDKIDETHAREANAEELQLLDRLTVEFGLTYLSTVPQLRAEPLELPSGFKCGAGARGCLHPSRPEGGFHALAP